jgi:hypothetical protein
MGLSATCGTIGAMAAFASNSRHWMRPSHLITCRTHGVPKSKPSHAPSTLIELEPSLVSAFRPKAAKRDVSLDRLVHTCSKPLTGAGPARSSTTRRGRACGGVPRVWRRSCYRRPKSDPHLSTPEAARRRPGAAPKMAAGGPTHGSGASRVLPRAALGKQG